MYIFIYVYVLYKSVTLQCTIKTFDREQHDRAHMDEGCMICMYVQYSAMESTYRLLVHLSMFTIYPICPIY